MLRSGECVCVLTELKNLSAEADDLADSLPKVSDLQPFFDAIKETALKIKDCTSVKQTKEIELPHDIHYYLNKKEDKEKIKVIHTPETQKEHVHAEKIATSGYKTAEKDIVNGRKEKIVISVCKSSEKDRVPEVCLSTSEEKSNSVAPLTKLSKKTPKSNKTSYDVEISKQFKTPCTAQQTIEISAPILNRTITKESNQTPLNKNLFLAGEDTVRVTRSGSRKKAQEVSSEVVRLPGISSGVKQRLQGDENKSSSLQVRSGSKRKSASSKEKEKNKRIKMEVKNKSLTSQSKPTLKSNILRQANGQNLNPKSSAIIMPTFKQSIPSEVDLKEKKLEEIQKKEEKANKNRKKVLADRQLKAEEQKKKREEKMEKALQKRLLLDKEKDLDRSMDTKMSQAKVLVESVKKPILKQKCKESQEQQVPEVASSTKQKEVPVQATNKTPAKKSSNDSETYDLTPAPDSSTYDFSDDEQDEPKGKPIPSWASGVLLKSALIQQFYYPPDTNAIFGTCIEAPDLAELFGVRKNYYFKRTSSAVWNTTPN